jgi:hypothetical protein
LAPGRPTKETIISANNQLVIQKLESGKWQVADTCVETGMGFVPHSRDFKTIEEAIKYAENYMACNIVEYGIHFLDF